MAVGVIRHAGSVGVLVASLAPSVRWTEGASAAPPDGPLNVLIVLADQHHARALGCYGNGFGGLPAELTPSLDQLADQGVRFDAAVCAAPQCTPSRFTLFTGRWPHHHGARWNDVWEPQGAVTFAGLARAAGYETAHIGKHSMKWLDQAEPRSEDLGFSTILDLEDYEAYCADAGRPVYHAAGNYQGMPGLVGALDPRTGYTFSTNEFHPSGYFADRAIEFLEQRAGPKGDGRPFVCWVSMYGPHTPILPSGPTDPNDWAHRFHPFEDLQLPPNLDKIATTRRLDQLQATYAPIDDDQWREVLSYYYGLVAQIDFNVGRILERLGELGLAESTVVVYTADHGDMASEMSCWTKGAGSYEATSRVPLLVRLPGVTPSGKEVGSVVNNVDLVPTLLELTGVPIRDAARAVLDGHSLLDLALRRSPPAWWPQETFSEFGPGPGKRHRMVRTEVDKYAIDEWNDYEEYYDLASDPFEIDDRHDDPAVQARVAELRALLEEWWGDETGHAPIYASTGGADQAPAPASDPAPAAGSVDVPRDADLAWLPSTAADVQRVYFGPGGDPPLFRELDAMASGCNVGTLAANTTYAWRVEGANDNGTNAGEVWTFTTGTGGEVGPGLALVPIPPSGATCVTLDAILAWRPPEGALGQDLYLGPEGALALLAADLPGDTASFSPGALAGGTLYRWRVDTHGPLGVTVGEEWAFETDATGLPERATLPRPAHLDPGAFHFGGRAFTWTPGADATSHDVYLGTDFPLPFRGNRTVAHYRPDDLVAGQTYYWRVDEVNERGTTRGWTWRFVYRPPADAGHGPR